MFFTLIFDGGGLILSNLFSFVKKIEKVNFWEKKVLHSRLTPNFLTYRDVYGLGVPWAILLDTPGNVLFWL